MLNRLVVLLLVAVLGTGWSVASHASEPVQLAQADAKKEKAKKKKDKRVCRKVRTTGSRIPERVCRKESEWKRIEDNARENVEEAFEKGARVSSGDA